MPTTILRRAQEKVVLISIQNFHCPSRHGMCLRHPRCPSADFEAPSPSFFFAEILMFLGPPAIWRVWPVRFGDGRLGSIGHEIGHVIGLWLGCKSLASVLEVFVAATRDSVGKYVRDTQMRIGAALEGQTRAERLEWNGCGNRAKVAAFRARASQI
jgi:hypothetical protein